MPFERWEVIIEVEFVNCCWRSFREVMSNKVISRGWFVFDVMVILLEKGLGEIEKEIGKFVTWEIDSYRINFYNPVIRSLQGLIPIRLRYITTYT
jgi:hypothetical protein